MWALSWELVPAGSLLPSVMRALWRQALTHGLPKFSDVRPVVRVHSCQGPIPMGMWAFCSVVPTAGLLTVSECGPSAVSSLRHGSHSLGALGHLLGASSGGVPHLFILWALCCESPPACLTPSPFVMCVPLFEATCAVFLTFR